MIGKPLDEHEINSSTLPIGLPRSSSASIAGEGSVRAGVDRDTVDSLNLERNQAVSDRTDSNAPNSTGEQRAVETLRLSDAGYRRLFEPAPDGLLRLAPE